jgi:hypothetical protein
MHVRSAFAASVCLLIFGLINCASFAQPRLGERISEGVQDVGRGIKRGAQDVGDGVRRQFNVVRADVQRMETHNRVYSRLHWDRSLHGSKIEVYMLRDGTALLMGTVPDQTAREHAVAIVSNTVGITSVIDELTPIVPPKAAAAPSSKTTTAAKPSSKSTR